MYNLPKQKKIMSSKMLKFVEIGQQTPLKEKLIIGKTILTKFTMNF